MGDSQLGLYVKDFKVRVAIIAWVWGAYLGDEGLQNGIRAKISSFSRHHVNAGMTKAKICGNYVNSIFAKREAVSLGFDEAIMLDTEGYVSEASGENIFVIKKGRIKTTPLTSVLPGITRACVMQIARDLGYEVVEERFTRDELYTVDEAFLYRNRGGGHADTGSGWAADRTRKAGTCDSGPPEEVLRSCPGHALAV